MAIELRDATESDIPAITAIYAHHVLHGTGSFEIEPPDEAEMLSRMRRTASLGYPYYVAVEGGRVLGYCYGGKMHPRKAYDGSVEDSIYVAPDAARRGIGTLLLSRLVQTCRERGYRQMVALIGDSENRGSIGVHTKLGYQRCGVMRGVGYKFGRELDLVLMQLPLGGTAFPKD